MGTECHYIHRQNETDSGTSGGATGAGYGIGSVF